MPLMQGCRRPHVRVALKLGGHGGYHAVVWYVKQKGHKLEERRVLRVGHSIHLHRTVPCGLQMPLSKWRRDDVLWCQCLGRGRLLSRLT